MINGHGDDLYQIKESIKYNFSSNVYYKGCPELILNALKENIEAIQNYPSPAAQELNVLAARKFNLSADQFLFTNGATEAFYLIAQYFKSKTALILGPTFSEYEDACKIHEIKFKVIPRELPSFISEDLVFICNPNNPDGSIFSFEVLAHVILKNPETTFIIDEAYIEFTDEISSVISLTSKYDNLVVVRSLTKTFTIPGLRLGYIVANQMLINDLLNIKMPWSVNALAIKMGAFIFENYEKLIFDVKELIADTECFKKALNDISSIEIIKGHTSYSLLKLKKGKAEQLKKYLIEKHQILIRNATNFNGIEGEYIRLSVQSKEANKTLIYALKEWI